VLSKASGADGDVEWSEPGGGVEAWRSVGASGEPAFGSGWSNYGGTHQVVQFRLRADGDVELRGLTTGGSNGTSIFTLPSGYRPTEIQIFLANFANVGGRLDVDSSGAVIPWTGSNPRSLLGARFSTT
jgi:hypothetical protein